MIQQIEFSMQNVFQLYNIEKECFGKEAWTVNNLIAEFHNDYSYFLGEVVDDTIVGYACVRVMYEEAQVCNIAVLPEYRRQGIGTRLLQSIAELATANSCERCELEVNTANTATVKLYEKCGYEIVGTRRNYYRRTKRYPTRDAYTMVMKLS